MPSHYEEEKKVERSRLPGLKPGEKLTTAGPGIEAIKSAVSRTGGTLFGDIAPEIRGGYRGYETGDRAGTGFMESGIPIPPDQAGVMQPMPARPAVGTTGAPMVTLPDGIGGSGTVGTGGAMPTSPVDLTPRLGEIEAGVEGALPAAFDKDRAHRLAMAKYPEGQPRLPAAQQSVYGDAIDSVLGPAPTVQPTPQGIPSEITPPVSSGNAMVDLFRWVSHNKRVQQQNKMMAEQEKLGLESERYAGEQEFKERELASEEKGREGALNIKRRQAIATEAKSAEKLDPFKKRAMDLLQKDPNYPFLEGEEKRTAELKAIEEVEKRHGRSEKKPKLKEGDEKIINGVTYKVVGGKVVKL